MIHSDAYSSILPPLIGTLYIRSPMIPNIYIGTLKFLKPTYIGIYLYLLRKSGDCCTSPWGSICWSAHHVPLAVGKKMGHMKQKNFMQSLKLVVKGIFFFMQKVKWYVEGYVREEVKFVAHKFKHDRRIDLIGLYENVSLV